MKLYIQNFDLPNMKLTPYSKEQNQNIEFLSEYGKYKMISNKIKLYKLNKTTNCKLDNFVNTYSFIASKEEWKCYKEVFYLPKNIISFLLKRDNYKIDNKLSFVIEKNKNNEVLDYYFYTKYDIDDFCLKQEIISFFSHLNNS